MSDEHRQKLIILLAEEKNGLNVSKLAKKTTLYRPIMSHHLKVLKQAGLVEVEERGTEHYYYLTLKQPVDRLKTLIH